MRTTLLLAAMSIGQNHGLLLRGASVNEGMIRLAPSGIDPLAALVLRESASIAGSGTIRLDEIGAEVGTGARDEPWAAVGGQRIIGAGTWHANATLANHGTLSVGDAAGSIGIISGDIRLQSGGRLMIDIGGAQGTTDLMILSGDAAVGGRLELRFAPGFEPGAEHWSRTIVTTEAVDPGRFAEVLAPSGVRFVEVAHEIRAGVSCPSDANLDLVSDAADARLFVRWFVSGEERAVLAAPFGTLNVFDLTAFDAGCG